MDQFPTQFDHYATRLYMTTTAAPHQDYPLQEWGGPQFLHANVIPDTPFVPEPGPVRLFSSALHSLPLDPQRSILSHGFPPAVYGQEERSGYWDAGDCATLKGFAALDVDPFTFGVPNLCASGFAPSTPPHHPPFSSWYPPQSHVALGSEPSIFPATWESFPDIGFGPQPTTFPANWGPFPDVVPDPQPSTILTTWEPSPNVNSTHHNLPPPTPPTQEPSHPENTAPHDTDESPATRVFHYIDSRNGNDRCVCVWRDEGGEICGHTSRIDLIKRHIWSIHFVLR